MKNKTVIEFNYNGNFDNILNKWADEFNYKLKESNSSIKIYQRGNGILVAPMMLEVNKKNEKIILKAWLKFTFVVRLSVLFIFPKEMGIRKSEGFGAQIPKAMSRKAINNLLEKLGQEELLIS